ncbi:response regulator transcription factor [Chondrinema litorale]|uniref:response regulator transcription factor n=1 Tax=Chondrinema litorale TaxID=2994555 RepID=UPI00254390FC|nr:response regulator transcription factor [Chondrinema litorale]UZR97249.1 response regulator transcription factor [Chondrinema litorale]
MKKNVLIVEDDQDIVELLSIHLTDLDCELTKAADGLSGYEYAAKNNYDLIILDLMLPEMDGLEICRKLRAQEIHTPILMLTARAEEIDKVLGLETGADDYITKPFSVREFIARVKAIFRRIKLSEENAAEKKVLSYGNMQIDVAKRKVSLNEQRIELTPKEFDLLYLLASRPGRSYSREELLNIVWGYEFSGYEHTVNSHVNRLRSKIEPNINELTYILTTWGVGYRFNDEW